jgi:hypothetical protein
MTEENAACAHLKVKYDPVKHRNGSLSARWVCELCGHEFVPKSWLQGVVENRDSIAVSNAELGLLLVDQLDIKEQLRVIYELLLGDTDSSPWHSQYCYVSGAHRDQNLCSCGLTEARMKLRDLFESLPMPSLEESLKEREPEESCSYCSDPATELIDTDAGLMPACDFHAKDPKKLNPKQAKRFVQLAVSKDELAEKEEKYTFTGVSLVKGGGHPFKIVSSDLKCEGCGLQASPLGEGPPLMREITIGCEKGRLLCPDCLALARVKDEG